jgi:homoaconitase/3-isopropylmalate dehydratase large subunit
MIKLKEKGKVSKKWTITKFASQKDFEEGKPYKESVINHNCLVNEGINELWTIVCSDSGDEYSNANANLIVGTGSGAATATDTEATFTAGVKKTMDSGYPTYGTDQKATWRATYAADEANQVWQEFGVLNAASSGDLLNRLVSNQGTKTSGQVWQLTFEITLS